MNCVNMSVVREMLLVGGSLLFEMGSLLEEGNMGTKCVDSFNGVKGDLTSDQVIRHEFCP